jgi:FkbM family methyltransferase
MLTGLYGAGVLGRTLGRAVDFPFVFVDDTPSKIGTFIDGHEVIDLASFARRAASESVTLYICIYQPGFSFLHKREQIHLAHPAIAIRPFSELLLSSAVSALPYLFFEHPDALTGKLVQYRRVSDLLADDLSVKTLEAHLALRLTGRFENVLATPRRNVPFLTDALSPDVTYVDAGAYDGDTAEDFVSISNGRFARIHLVEPDAVNIRRAEKRLSGLGIADKVTLHREAIADKHGIMGFNALGSVGSSLDPTADGTVTTVPLSDFDTDGQLYLKLDIEGAEIPSIGAVVDFISRKRPLLAISVYHRPDDLLDAVRIVGCADADYALYVRCHGAGGEDLMLYAIPRV